MLVNPEKAFQSKSSPGKAKAGNSFVSVYVDLTSFTSRRCQGSQSITIDSGPQIELFQVVLTPYIKYYLNPSLPSTKTSYWETGDGDWKGKQHYKYREAVSQCM